MVFSFHTQLQQYTVLQEETLVPFKLLSAAVKASYKDVFTVICRPHSALTASSADSSVRSQEAGLVLQVWGVAEPA